MFVISGALNVRHFVLLIESIFFIWYFEDLQNKSTKIIYVNVNIWIIVLLNFDSYFVIKCHYSCKICLNFFCLLYCIDTVKLGSDIYENGARRVWKRYFSILLYSQTKGVKQKYLLYISSIGSESQVSAIYNVQIYSYPRNSR